MQVDLWSLGVVLYIMLFGYSPWSVQVHRATRPVLIISPRDPYCTSDNRTIESVVLRGFRNDTMPGHGRHAHATCERTFALIVRFARAFRALVPQVDPGVRPGQGPHPQADAVQPGPSDLGERRDGPPVDRPARPVVETDV